MFSFGFPASRWGGEAPNFANLRKRCFPFNKKIVNAYIGRMFI